MPVLTDADYKLVKSFFDSLCAAGDYNAGKFFMAEVDTQPASKLSPREIGWTITVNDLRCDSRLLVDSIDITDEVHDKILRDILRGIAYTLIVTSHPAAYYIKNAVELYQLLPVKQKRLYENSLIRAALYFKMAEYVNKIKALARKVCSYVKNSIHPSRSGNKRGKSTRMRHHRDRLGQGRFRQ